MPVQLVCQTCGSLFQRPRSHVKKNSYCSKKCGLEDRRKPRGFCERCGVVIPFTRYNKKARFCGKKCSGAHTAENRKSTKGWVKTMKGYIYRLEKEHPHATRAGYVMEHRLVMEAHLGRLLLPSEVVHHKNGIRDDNRLENLEAMSKATHDHLSKEWGHVICPHCNRAFPPKGAQRVHLNKLDLESA